MKKLSNQQILAAVDLLKDDYSETEKAYRLLYDLVSRSAHNQVPLLEIITVLKHRKPLLHKLLKPRFTNRPQVSMLFDLTMDVTVAEKKLLNS